MDRRGRNQRVTPHNLRDIQNVDHLFMAVADPVADHGDLLGGAQVGEVDGGPLRWPLNPSDVSESIRTSAPDFFAVLSIAWQEQLDWQDVADVVGFELDLVAVCVQGRWMDEP